MRATLTVLGILLASRGAAAQDCVSVRLRGCESWLDEQAVVRALEVEANTHTECSPALTRILVSCRDGGAEVHVRGRAPVTYPLESIPVSVRSRVIALLLAERLREPETMPSDPPLPESREGADVRGEPADGAARAPDSSTPAGPAPSLPQGATAGPTSALTSAAMLSAPSPPHRAREPVESVTREPETQPPEPPAARHRAHPLALWVKGAASDAAASPRLAIAGELTAFLQPATWVAGPVISATVGPVQAELGWGVGRASDAFGSARLALLRASVGLALVCRRWTVGSLCATAWGTLGQARAAASPMPEAIGRSARGPFAAAALELGASLAWPRFALRLGLRGGYGSGLVLLSAGRELAALGGPFFTTTLALEFAPF